MYHHSSHGNRAQGPYKEAGEEEERYLNDILSKNPYLELALIFIVLSIHVVFLRITCEKKIRGVTHRSWKVFFAHQEQFLGTQAGLSLDSICFGMGRYDETFSSSDESSQRPHQLA